MRSRREQLQAHRFLVGRLVSALVRAEPDAPESPNRRSGTGLFGGMMIAVLLVAGFAVYGLVSPGGETGWRKPGALIVEKETGASYVLAGDELRPVLNYASARLLLGTQLEPHTVASASLKGTRHGTPIGIPGAPDALPAAGQLTGAAWQVCATQVADESGTPRSRVGLTVGGRTGTVLPADQALLVRAPGSQLYLVVAGRRLRFADRWVVDAMGYGDVQPIEVGAGWINSVPAGPDLAPPAIPRRGEPGPPVDNRPTRIGQVMTVRGVSDESSYLVLADGLAPLTRTEAALALFDPANRGAYGGGPVQPVPLDPAALAGAPRAAAQPARPLPTTPPRLASGLDRDRVPCVRITPQSAGARSELVLAAPPPLRGPAGGPFPPKYDSLSADGVWVQPGHGVLARAQAAPGVSGGTLYLVTDVGAKYPLSSDDVAELLGYSAREAVPVPTTLLALLPTGAVLDPVAARTGGGPAARPGG
ncbi:type VII secretion protein EccB [Planosporangium thailandense]|uniref:Type VII secretion protein EccB n=1 Tax=Planosporangium thailandense TaxID=765197 RepID=A0ABX0Y0Z3_9ACTN|nr:type VII secretion protein EccB [Planosporangium thailandense]NJC72029.1 type VII secretion protein EccB [Planosporangium thailandense]